MKLTRIKFLALLLACPVLPALSQVKCTMPNGAVITQQLSSTCPAGAVNASTIDGQPIALPAAPPKQQPPTATPRPAVAAAAPVQQRMPAPTPAREPSAYEYAGVICKMLESAGATTCEVNSNIMSPSTIDATLPTTPRDASQVCVTLASTMRTKTNAFQNKDWKLLIFSPFSGNRPIASCKL